MCTSNLKPIEFHSDSSNIDNYFNHTFVTSNLAFVYVNGNKENYIALGYHSNNGNHTESAFRFFEEDGQKKEPATEINISPVPDIVSGSRHFVPVTRSSRRSAVYMHCRDIAQSSGHMT